MDASSSIVAETREAPCTEPREPRRAVPASPSILVVDDEPNIRRLLSFKLSRAGYEVTTAESGEEALDGLRSVTPDLLLLDLRLPGMHGLEVLERLEKSAPELPVVVLTAQGSVETAVDAMKRGARDFLTKPLELPRLEVAVRNALELGHLRRKVEDLQGQLSDLRGRGPTIIGRDSGLRETFSMIEKVIPTDLTVLVQGESGTGKELVAQAIHAEGPRRSGPFVAVSCAAIPEALLESELFGHVKGAFTGADADRPGRFEAAHRGTLLLDEIGELSESLQVKLLRTLQDGTVTRLGSTTPTPIDVRIICATHRHLEEQVRYGSFRGDLYYRIAVFPVTLPPLRERSDDIPDLCRHVLAQARPGMPPQIHTRAMEMLEAHTWPGNVRELQNVMRRASVLAGDGEIEPEHLSAPVQAAVVAALTRGAGAADPARGPAGTPAAGPDAPGLLTLDDMERAHILRTMESCAGNLSLTARTLGIGRTTLYRKLRRYGVAASPS